MFAHQISAFLFGHKTSSPAVYGDEFAAHLHSALVTLMSDVDDRLVSMERKLFRLQLDEMNTTTVGSDQTSCAIGSVFATDPLTFMINIRLLLFPTTASSCSAVCYVYLFRPILFIRTIMLYTHKVVFCAC